MAQMLVKLFPIFLGMSFLLVMIIGKLSEKTCLQKLEGRISDIQAREKMASPVVVILVAMFYIATALLTLSIFSIFIL